ncbi:glycosyltransferase [Anaerophaga thermohalophila]|uniref:glycosyltransferase n=1 Tax=Anaerophaga thermohalophila TaxID=177400 RepID=UPI000237D39B|nr:glycosyltransferase [Anaerophaga thermohalophila]
MNSIIVCHRQPALLNQFKKNITATIGSEYEFIVINNTANDYNIFQAYNLGVKQSKGDILCFAHEDILFHTQDWGQKLDAHFKSTPDIGLIGTIGGTALPACPAPWWNKHPFNQHFLNIIQHWRKGDNIHRWEENIPLNKEQTIVHHKSNPYRSQYSEVAAVDGLFFAIPRHLFDSIKFDEDTFSGFHGYDIDTCLQVQNVGYKVAVVHDILIEHLSKGNPNEQWSNESIVLARKWKSSLPIVVKSKHEISQKDKDIYTINLLLTFCYWSMKNISDKKIREVIKEFIPQNKNFLSQKHYFLWLWSFLGYNISRILFKLTKSLIHE